MESHRIAVISDTHGMLRPEIIDILKTCEVILHGGDVGRPELIRQLKALRQTYAVRGNVDKDWECELPNELEAEFFGFQVYMVHNKKHIRKDLPGIDIVIYGHSHKYEVSSKGAVTYLNPGSCGPRRFRQPVTMMVLTLYPDAHQIETEKIDCMAAVSQKSETSQKEEMFWLSHKDMHKLIKRIMEEVDAGRNVADIAVRNHIEEELAEQICRIYVTHPGVNVDGVMDRMERKDL